MKHDVYWRDVTPLNRLPPCEGDAECDVVIVGGGMAGLSAAQWLVERGDVNVVVLEAEHCGAGASGHNSGSIIPDAVQDVHQLVGRFGERDGGELARAAHDSVEEIRRTIERYGIDCDLVEADALYVASGSILAGDVGKEHQARQQVGLPSLYHDDTSLRDLIGTGAYTAGISFGGSLGINSFKYVLGLRDALAERGVRIHEGTRALSIAPQQVVTQGGVVRAKHVLVCIDRLAPELGIEAPNVHHQQHFIAVSDPLDPATARALFPDRPLIVHALGRMYHYFRLTPDNRLVLGGMPLGPAYGEQRTDPSAELDQLIGYARDQLPMLHDVGFSHGWSGLFGLSKDLLPIAGRVCAEDLDGVSVALCAGSMAWSLLAGQIAAQAAWQGAAPLERFFAPGRAHTPIDQLLAPLGKQAAFPLAHLYSKGLLKGPPERVARQQYWLGAGLMALAAGAALVAGRRLRRRSHERD